MHIREAQVADIPAYMGVRLAVKENPLNAPGLVTYEDNVDYLTHRGKGWVAEVNGRIVGFAIADLKEHSVWALFVRPDCEHRARYLRRGVLPARRLAQRGAAGERRG